VGGFVAGSPGSGALSPFLSTMSLVYPRKE
jgi:hypothetical protein